ncbi:MAG: hypothetical protein IJN78_04255 [Clostridia bacterium]|nr:hypothetical protein [Clostridia bacterium]
MPYNFDDYLNVVKQNIKNKKLHATICAELESHLQDSADFYVEIGYDEVTANKKALEDMGKPDKVGFTFSKLHDVSKAQKILIGLYCFITTVKIIDTAISMVLASPFRAEPLTDALFPFFADFFYLVIFITCGIALSLRTNRKAPAAFAAILTAADYYSVFVFNLVSFTTLKGKLSDAIMHIVWEEYAPDVILTEEYIIAYLLTGVFFIIATALFVGTFITVSRPFASAKRFTRNFAAVSCMLICISAVSVFGVCSYVNAKDREQYEKYSAVVSDTVDLLKEMKTIRPEDAEKVFEHFDYLTFSQSSDVESGAGLHPLGTHYYAVIGEPFLCVPMLCIDIYDDGSVTIYYSFDEQHEAIPTAPFLFFELLFSDFGRWENSKAEAHKIDDYIEKSAEGDSADELFDIIKRYNCDFTYINKFYMSYDEYSFFFHFPGKMAWQNVHVRDGKFVWGESEWQ